MRKVVAYSFSSALRLDDMQGKLKANTGWSWTQRVNDTHGEYLVSRPHKDYARLRIFPEPANRYVLDALYEGQCAADKTWETLDSQIRDKILPEIGASGVKSADSFD